MVASRIATPIADDILLASSCQRQRTSQNMIFKPRRSHAPNRSLLRSNRPSADRNFRVSSPARWEPVIRAPGRTAGEPGNPSSAGRPPRGPRATKQRPFVRDGRRPPRGGTEAHRLGPVDVGQQSVTATPDGRARPRRVAATHLSRASPSGTRSRSGGAPLARPAQWRAA
jgi:hypothetical protein